MIGVMQELRLGVVQRNQALEEQLVSSLPLSISHPFVTKSRRRNSQETRPKER